MMQVQQVGAWQGGWVCLVLRFLQRLSNMPAQHAHCSEKSATVVKLFAARCCERWHDSCHEVTCRLAEMQDRNL